MKFKKWLLGLVAVATFASATVFAACNDEIEPPEPGVEAGMYFRNDANQDSVIVLDGLNGYVYLKGSDRVAGAYALEGETVTFTEEGEQISASLDGNILTVYLDGGVQIRYYRQVNYTVTFDSAGGGNVAPVTVTNGKTVAKPVDPVRPGHVFLGWYADSAHTTPFLFDAQPITTNTTLYAYWAPRTIGQNEYTVDFDLRGENTQEIEAVQTNGGRLYNVPTPVAPAGKTFGGWWISMYDDGEKLSYPYSEGMVFEQNTTLFARWVEPTTGGKLSTPVIEINGDTIRWSGVSGAVSTYQVEVVKIVDGNETSVYNAPVSGTMLNSPITQKGDYKISVTAVASNTANNSDTAVIWYKHNALASVSLFSVVDPSVLIFNAVPNAQNYYITVDCGNKAHNHTTFALGNSTTFNFKNCAMQEGGIRFTVVAEAEGYASSVSKTFVYNRVLAQIGEFDFDEANETLFWDAIPDAASYVVSVSVNGTVFEEVDIGNKTSFSLKKYPRVAEGQEDIAISVYPKTKGYNSPAVRTFTYHKERLATPDAFRIQGETLSWTPVDGAASYEVRIGTQTYPVAQGDAPQEDRVAFDLSAVSDWVNANDYRISVRAVGATSASNSLWSDEADVRYYALYSTVAYDASVLSWRHVIGAEKYQVRINGDDENLIEVENGENFAEIALDREGVNTLEVRFVADGVNSAWAGVEVFAHRVTFDTRVQGEYVAPKFLAFGDKVAFDDATPEKTGYKFEAWYNTPEGPATNGAEYNDEYFSESGELVLYAYYTPKTYTVTYDYQGGNAGAETKDVVYDSEFELAVPTTDDATKSFGGWFSNIGGTGTQYTDELGHSLRPWTVAENTIAYAFWQDRVLDYSLTTVRGYNGKVYSVSAGSRINLVNKVTVPTTYKGIPVMVIASGAFRNCAGLEEIEIPDTIRLVSEGRPFQGCSSLRAVNVYATLDENGDPNRMVRYWSHEGVLYDYGSFDDRPDVGVVMSEVVFFPYAKTGSYTIPDSVATIRSEVFSECALSGIEIPASVTMIEAGAFYNCKNLSTVTFLSATGAAPLTIGDRAFRACTSLEEITLPARLDTISFKTYTLSDPQYVPVRQDVSSLASNAKVTNAFVGCNNLKNIDVEEGNAKYSAKNGIVLSADGTKIIFAPAKNESIAGNYTILPNVTSIEDGAFLNCDSITSLTIPNIVTSIGEAAFYDCDGIASVTFQGNGMSSVTVGKYAFRDCGGLKGIVFEEGSQVKTLEEGAFFKTGLTSVTLPASMEKVGVQAFRECASLGSVAFAPNGKELEFGTDVFYQCTSLTEFRLPANVTKLPGVFGGCSALERVIVDENNPNFTSIDGILFDKNIDEETGENHPTQILYFPQGRGGAYEIPQGIETIENGVFRNNAYLTSVTIPNTVLLIGDQAFEGCGSLLQITFTGGGTKELVIGTAAFRNCDALSSVVLPDRTQKIGDNAFENLDALYTLTLNEGLESIGSYAIYSNTNLRAITIPSTVTEIKDYGVAYNNNLSNLHFAPESTLEKIGTNAFYSLAITTVTIPKSVKTIGQFAFYSGRTDTTQSTLKEVKFEEGTQLETIGAYAFQYTAIESITIPKTVKTIGPYAFYNCRFLDTLEFEEGGTEDLTIGASVTITSTSASNKNNNYGWTFASCGALTSINLPARVTELGKYTFNYCSRMTSITFGTEEEHSKLSYIGANCFAYCQALTSIVIPNTVRDLTPDGSNNRLALGELAFENCYALSSVVFEEGGSEEHTVTLGKNVFNSCRSLRKVILPANLSDSYGEGDAKEEYPITASTFSGCSTLTDIEIREGGSVYASDNGIVYNGDFTELFFCLTPKQGDIVIPASVEKIADRAFDNCDGITSVSFGKEDETSQLTEIGERAFYDCDGISTLVLPSGVTTIGSSAFGYCGQLTSIKLSKDLSSFDSTIFAGCNQLTNIDIEEGNETYSSVEGVIFTDGGKTLLYYPRTRSATSYTVPEGVTKIENNAFYDCDHLTSVTLPAGLQIISYRAFYHSSFIQKITIPNTVTLIDDEAFSYCKSLDEVEFEPNGTQPLVIGSGEHSTGRETYGRLSVATAQYTDVFAYTDKLTTITFPARLQKIADRAFYRSALQTVTTTAAANGIELTLGHKVFNECKKLTTVTFNEGLKTLGVRTFYNCTRLNTVKLPASLSEMGFETFYHCDNLNSVTFDTDERGESNLMLLPNGTFAYCAKLESIVLPSSITELPTCTNPTSRYPSIGSSSTSYTPHIFFGCDALTSISFTNNKSNLQTVGNYALSGTKISSFEIPKSVNSIGTYMFSGCTELTSVTFEAGSAVEGLPVGMFDGCSSLTSFTIPSHILRLGTTNNSANTAVNNNSYLFRNTGLTRIVIPNTVIALGGRLFDNCEDLEEIDLSNLNTNITEIPQYFVNGCKKITSLDIPSHITSYATNCFAGSSFTSFTIPASMTAIPNSMFSGSADLESVTIHENVTSIGNDVFYNCTSLTSITLPASLTTLGTRVFGGSGITEITIPDKITTIANNMFQNCASLGKVNLPSGLLSIGTGVFQNCTSLTSIRIPDSVKTIGASAPSPTNTSTSNNTFMGCTNLESITLPAGGEFVYLQNGTFSGCTSLNNVTIPNSVTHIGTGNANTVTNVFLNCTGLTTITLPSSLQAINCSAFEGSGLTSISIPDTVTTIGMNAFKNSKSLANVKLPSSITALSASIFEGCDGLTGITLPQTLQSVSNGLFSGSGLVNITLPASVTTIEENAFANCGSLTSIELPGVTEIRANAFNGCTVIESISLPLVQNVGESAFAGCTVLDSVDFSSATIIGENAFAGCAKLQNVVMSNALTEIGNRAFEETVALRSIELSQQLTSIGEGAFYGSGLQSLTVPQSVATISANAFENCVSLEVVYLSDGVTEIGDYAFRGCTMLSDIEVPAGVVTMGLNPFLGCTSLETYKISDSNAAFRLVDGVLFNSDGTRLYSYPVTKTGAYTVPEGVTVMPYAFTGVTVGDLVFSDKVTIGEHAFENSVIASITFAGTTGGIGDYAFYGATGFETVVIPSGVTKIGHYAFQNSGIKSVTVPNTVIDVGCYSFESAENLSAVIFEAGGTVQLHIGAYAFQNCTSLVEILIPSRTRVDYSTGAESTSSDPTTQTMQPIGHYAFYGCANLESVTLEETPAEGGVEGVFYIGAYAFAECASLKAIAFPAALGRRASPVYGLSSTGHVFENCVSLESVTFNCPAGTAPFRIGTGTFFGCTALKHITIPAALEAVSAYTFENSGLEEITLPSTMSGNATTGVFRGCENLKSAVINWRLASITNETFANCTSLQSVEIRTSTVTTIGSKTFLNCTALTDITLPSTITTVNANAFENCTSIATLRIPASVLTMRASVFAGWTAAQTIIIEGGEEQIISWDAEWNADCAANIVYAG